MEDNTASTIEELDIKEIGIWPIQFRAAVLVGIALATVILMYMFLLKDSLGNFSSLKSKQNQLKTDFVSNYTQAIGLNIYEQQMVDIQEMLQLLLRKLPSKGEIPALLEDISRQAVSSGLEFELIKPEDPVDKGFYYEQPIKMVLIGQYHGFGNFITGLSRLPRIVTLHDFAVRKKEANIVNSDLVMEIYAKTYWYAVKENI